MCIFYIVPLQTCALTLISYLAFFSAMPSQTCQWGGRASGWWSSEANNDDEWWKKENKESSTSWNDTGRYTEYTEQEWTTWKKSYSKGTGNSKGNENGNGNG